MTLEQFVAITERLDEVLVRLELLERKDRAASDGMMKHWRERQIELEKSMEIPAELNVPPVHICASSRGK